MRKGDKINNTDKMKLRYARERTIYYKLDGKLRNTLINTLDSKAKRKPFRVMERWVKVYMVLIKRYRKKYPEAKHETLLEELKFIKKLKEAGEL